MKKTISWLLALMMVGSLSACLSNNVAEHNGKVCPPGTQNNKSACNRNPPKSPGS